MNWIKKNKKTIIASFIVYVILAGFGYYYFFSPGLPVDAFKVSKGVVIDSIKETGTVLARNTTMLYGNTQGKIKAINFQEGDVVKKGDIILRLDEDAAALNIRSLREQASALWIQLDQAKKLSAKSKILFDEGAISQSDYDNTVYAEKELGKQLSALNFSIASASASSQSGGFVSPMDGVVTGLLVKVNNTMQIGAPVIEISDLSNIYISTSLVSSDADSIKTGAKVIVTGDNDSVIDNSALVEKIGIKAHDETSELGISQKRVTVEIKSSRAKSIRLGSNVQLEIIVKQQDKALRVDNKALYERDKKNYVYLIQSGKATETQVNLGVKGADYSEIINGIKDGDLVIISPDNSISNGIKVSIKTQI